MINQKEIGALKSGSFEIDCKSIRLTKRSQDDPVVYEGPGSVRQTYEGTFEFKIYNRELADSTALMSRLDSVRTGEIIPDSEYFDFLAIDTRGREWSSDTIHISPPSYSGERQSYVIIKGTTASLQIVDEYPQKNKEDYVELTFFGLNKFPFTDRKRIEIKEENKTVGLNHKYVVEDENSKYPVFCEKTEKLINVRVSLSKSTMIPNFDLRVLEALGFILGQIIQPDITRLKSGNRLTTILRCIKVGEIFPWIEPPIHIRKNPHNTAKHSWNLFQKYLRYVSIFKEDGLSPLGVETYLVILSGSSDFTVQSLVLSVAVEGILNSAYKDYAKPDKETLEAIENFKEYLIKWKGSSEILKRLSGFVGQMEYAKAKDKLRILNQQGVISNEQYSIWKGSAEILERLSGSVKQMGKIRAKDKLHKLIEQGIISKEQYDAWNEVRNKEAHADRLYNVLQQRLWFFDKILVLFYRLIFNAIGYEGLYTDYSLPDYPLWPYIKYRQDGA